MSSIRFSPVSSLPNLPELESGILAYWQQDKTFERSIDERPEEKRFTFYDGPPFATGLPHYGHILTSVLKDLIPRYKTMQGYRVERRWGWDCHGLPIENLIEKELGLHSKRAIEEYGVAQFNEACHAKVLQYAEEWERFMGRIGRWVDFEQDYKTMDRDYMESVWWAFSSLYERGLIYESHKVLWYCTRCATPLSNFEAGLDDAYRKRQDPSVTFHVKVTGGEQFEQLKNAWNVSNLYLWLWTTTPWTIPAHMAVAVNSDVHYELFRNRKTGDAVLLASNRKEAYQKELREFLDFEGDEDKVFDQVGELVKGSSLVGLTYDPPFPYFSEKGKEGAFRVVAAEFVTDTDGTGLAHEAPGFGADDFDLAQVSDVPIVYPVNESGEYTEEIPDYVGRHVHEAQADVIKALKAEGVVVRHETYDHSYPHCWRCDTPLIQKAVETWFVKVTEVRDRMVENNQRIHWVPERVKNGIFGNWLAGARDWAVSRNRYWGAPIPVWKCDDCHGIHVVSSVDELQRLSGKEFPDIHKQFVDDVEFSCSVVTGSECNGVLKRVPEVFDCWFESGSMPYAQQHYPFENQEVFKQSFPGDFITEYVGQTRGWFYTMTVLATALFDAQVNPESSFEDARPFKNVIVHGIVLAEDGRKMSKRLQNYPDPTELVDRYGSDALRLYLMQSAVIKGDDLRFSERELVELQRRVIMTLWNTYSFFLTYAHADQFVPSEEVEEHSAIVSEHVLDRWIQSRLQTFIEETTVCLEAYDVQKYVRSLEAFVEELSNWYVRRSRRRFWKSGNDTDKQHAEQTLYDVLKTLSQLIAPVTPFLAETIWQGLSEEGVDSVHLSAWPQVDLSKKDAVLEEDMARVRTIVNLGHSARETAEIRVRQPLAEVRVTGDVLDEAFQEIVCEELNVKSVTFMESFEEVAEKTYSLQFGKAGPMLKDAIGKVKQAVEAGMIEIVDDGYIAAGEHLTRDLVEISVRAVSERFAVAGDVHAVVAIDTLLTDDLKLEGQARELIRYVQQARKDAGYDVSDRITLYLVGDDAPLLASGMGELITNEVLATTLSIVDQLPEDVDIDVSLQAGDVTTTPLLFGLKK